MFMNSFSLALLFKEILVLLADTRVPGAQALDVLRLHVDSDPVPWPTWAHLRGRRDLVGVLPGHTCSLYTLAEEFHSWSVLLCSLSDLLKKYTASKLAFIRKCTKERLPKNTIAVELGKQPLRYQ